MRPRYISRAEGARNQGAITLSRPAFARSPPPLRPISAAARHIPGRKPWHRTAPPHRAAIAGRHGPICRHCGDFQQACPASWCRDNAAGPDQVREVSSLTASSLAIDAAGLDEFDQYLGIANLVHVDGRMPRSDFLDRTSRPQQAADTASQAFDLALEEIRDSRVRNAARRRLQGESSRDNGLRLRTPRAAVVNALLSKQCTGRKPATRCAAQP